MLEQQTNRESAESIFRNIRDYTVFEEKFGLDGKNVEWVGGLPESSQALLGFLQSTIYGTKHDGHFKSIMKSSKTAAEICAAQPFADEIEDWKTLLAKEACAGRSFQMANGCCFNF